LPRKGNDENEMTNTAQKHPLKPRLLFSTGLQTEKKPMKELLIKKEEKPDYIGTIGPRLRH
jgi:hypothetical protein